MFRSKKLLGWRRKSLLLLPTSENFHSSEANGGKTSFGYERKVEPNDAYGTMFGNVRSEASMALQKLKGLKPADYVKEGYNFVIEELEGKAGKRKHIEYTSPDHAVKIERSDRTDIMVVPSTKFEWSKKWELLKDKLRGHPYYKRLQGYSEPAMSLPRHAMPLPLPQHTMPMPRLAMSLPRLAMSLPCQAMEFRDVAGCNFSFADCYFLID